MSGKECGLLVHYLEGMIADGVQLVHGGHLLNWDDTQIPDILKALSSKQAKAVAPTLKPGDLVVNRFTKQKAAVVLVDDKTVQLLPSEKVLVYPKDIAADHFQKSKGAVRKSKHGK